MVSAEENINSELDDKAWYAVLNAVNEKGPGRTIGGKMCTILNE